MIQKDEKDKKHVERVLTGYEMRRENIKKMAMQKLREKQFKEDIKNKESNEEETKKKELEEKKLPMKNDIRREKLKAKPHPNVSLPAEDTDSDEDLNMTPEYLRGRDTYEDELEDRIITKKPYYKQNVLRGQTRGTKGWFFKKVANTQEIAGVFK